MLTMLMLAALPAYTAPPGLTAVGGLAGCWQAVGTVRGRDATSVARGEWHLGGRYFQFHLHATGPRPYEAAITFGAGERPQAIGSVFSDTFGGLYEPSLGSGGTDADGFVQRYRFTDAVYVNRFVRSGDGWRWTITEQTEGKPDAGFADYRLRRTPCHGLRFDW